MGAEDEFEMGFLLHGGVEDAVGFAFLGEWDFEEWAFAVVGVFVVVDVDCAVGAEVDRIGTRDPGAVDLVGVEDLRTERFPAAG